MKADESADCAVRCVAKISQFVALLATQRTAQSALASAFMVKNVLK
jgi:hypothetical protein